MQPDIHVLSPGGTMAMSKGAIGVLNEVQSRVLLTLLLCANVRDKAGLARHFRARTPV